MAKTFMQTFSGGVHVVCDGCRNMITINFPIPVNKFVKLTRKFEDEHTKCQDRPVTRCQYVDAQDGTCQHERNLTPECGIDICPLM